MGVRIGSTGVCNCSARAFGYQPAFLTAHLLLYLFGGNEIILFVAIKVDSGRNPRISKCLA